MAEIAVDTEKDNVESPALPRDFVRDVHAATKKLREDIDSPVYSSKTSEKVQELMKMEGDLIARHSKCKSEVVAILTSDAQDSLADDIIERVLSRILKSKYSLMSEDDSKKIALLMASFGTFAIDGCNKGDINDLELVMDICKQIGQTSNDQQAFLTQIGKIIQGEKAVKEKVRDLKLLFLMN